MKRRRIDVNDWLRYKRQKQQSYRQAAELSVSKMERIKHNKSTTIIEYPLYKEAFDYVDALFPERNVKSIKVYLCEKQFLNKIGLAGIGGCYNKITQTVVVSNDLNFGDDDSEGILHSIAKVETDEVIVHELLHYVYSFNAGGYGNMNLDEEFAYGNSAAYLKNKGYSDEEIIEQNFMPFLVSVTDARKICIRVLSGEGVDLDRFKQASEAEQTKLIRKYEDKLSHAVKLEATSMGKALLKAYKEEPAIYEVEENKELGMINFDW